MKNDDDKNTAALPDWVLCHVYSAWSEEAYAAGWMSGGVRSPGFAVWLKRQMTRQLEDYEREDIPDIRKALRLAQEVQE